jgi:aryl-alcohol dehydrogenase-like predicted oxidoreductase
MRVMEQRTTGKNGLAASALGLGCMSMTGAYGPADEKESISTVRRALELGVTLFDTADMYGPFTGERLLGRALAGLRDGAVIATKFGGTELDDAGNIIGGANGHPDYVRTAVDRALRNLNTDRIDLVFTHRVDATVPVEETFGALGELVAAGKVLHLGISEAAPDTIRRAHAAAPLSAVETEYSLFSRQVESNGVLAAVRELGIGFVAYAPLGRGFLTGTVRATDTLPETDLRRYYPRFEEASLNQNLTLLEKVEAIAESQHMTSSQLALAWVLAQGDDIFAIPGTRRRSHVEENATAARLSLDQGTLQALDSAVPPGAVTGDRRSAADPGIEE